MKKLEALRMAAALYKKPSGTLSELQNWKIESPLMQILDKVEKYFNKVILQGIISILSSSYLEL